MYKTNFVCTYKAFDDDEVHSNMLYQAQFLQVFGLTDYRDDAISHRVGTLVMRVAERAADWQARPTFVPWGTWSDGAIVFDGRWCAPLSVELARQLSGKLVAAKRAAAARAAGSPEHLP